MACTATETENGKDVWETPYNNNKKNPDLLTENESINIPGQFFPAMLITSFSDRKVYSIQGFHLLCTYKMHNSDRNGLFVYRFSGKQI